MTSQVSHPYKSTDFTQALNIVTLVSFRNDLDRAEMNRKVSNVRFEVLMAVLMKIHIF